MPRRSIMVIPKAIEIETETYRPPPRRNITDVVEPKAVEAVESVETIDAPDQFIDTDGVIYIPLQSANGAIRAALF